MEENNLILKSVLYFTNNKHVILNKYTILHEIEQISNSETNFMDRHN